jgi:putative thiamine transport system ATP-binding protein
MNRSAASIKRYATFRAWVFDAVRARNIPVVLVTHDEDDIPPGGEVIEISRWQ